jgi:iron complex outermembrane receptor protein
MGTYENARCGVAANRLLVALLAGSSLVSMAAPALAQEASPAAGKTPAATNSDDKSGLDEIVVTAQRRSERLQDVPSTVVSLSSKDLAKSGVTSLRDLGNVVAGFTFGGQGNTSQPAIRGVSTTISGSGSENPNALYVDGIYQQSSIALNNELPDVQRIEVLKGPQGTLFGRNATGGAIQIFTRGPSFTPQASFSIEPSYYTGSGTSHSASRISAKAFVAGPVVPGLLAASLSGGINYTAGYSTNDGNGQQDGAIRNANVRGKLLLTPSSNLAITVGGFYIDGDQAGIVLGTPYQGLSAANAVLTGQTIVANNGKPAYPGTIVPTLPYHSAYDPSPLASYATLKQYGGSARIELKTDAGTITSLTGYTKTITPAGAPIAYAQSTLPCLFNFACIDSYNTVSIGEFSQELNFASRQFGMVSFVAGLFYYDAKTDFLAGLDPILAPFVPGVFPLIVQKDKFRSQSYAAYAEVTIKPVEKLSLVLGGRYNHEPHTDIDILSSPNISISRTFDSFTPRASIKYEVTNHLNAYATVSVGNRSGQTGIGNANAVPKYNPVEPEKIISYEAGLKYASSSLSLNASAFYYDYKNKQEQTFLGTSAIVQNTGAVRIYGADFDARAKLTSSLTFRGTLSWIPVSKYLGYVTVAQSTTRIPFNADGTCPPFGSCGGFGTFTFNATGQRLIKAPEVTASGTLSYESGPLDASATVSYSSAVLLDITGVIRQPAYATVAAQMGYKIDDRFRVGVFGRNLTNQASIANALTSLSGFAVGYAPPREVGVSFSFNY